ncbi:MAG: transketolase [Nitrospirota bacterium]|nr:transketolase [Nitrospirota bacterium]
MNHEKLVEKSKQIRNKILDMVFKAKSGHITSAFSIVEILVTLYYRIMVTCPQCPDNNLRDRFIMSKGHGCVAQYVILADLGYFPEEELEKFAKPGGILGSHPDMCKIPGIEASTGSLGHGLSIAAGMALAAKIDKKDNKVFCLLGDGECQEGSVWEAAMFAAHSKLNNLIAIVDNNRLQAGGTIEETTSLYPLSSKWAAFHWNVRQVDGHDLDAIYLCLYDCLKDSEAPTVIIAHTVKGKGVSFMENNRAWHTMIPSEEEYRKAREELA